MDRRVFLSIVAGSPLIFGLKELLGQDPAPSDKVVPEWFNGALKRMKETNRFGLVIVLPEGAEERKRLGNALIARYQDPPALDYEAFWVVVVICLTRDQAARCLGELRADDNRVLLDPSGKKVQSDRTVIETLEDRRRFDVSLRQFVYGKEGQRLKDLASEIEKGMNPEHRKAVDAVADRGMGDGEAWTTALRAADAVMPWIIHEIHRKTPEVVRTVPFLQLLVGAWFIEQSNRDPDPCLPFGVKTELLPFNDPCPSCGLVQFGYARTRRFVSFYAK